MAAATCTPTHKAQQGALIFHTDKPAVCDVGGVRPFHKIMIRKNDCSLKVNIDVEMAFSMAGFSAMDYNLPFTF